MPESLSPAQALEQISPILADLSAAFASFTPDVQQRLGELYATLRAEIAAARMADQQLAALARFLAALDTLPEVRAVVGALPAPVSQTSDDSTIGEVIGSVVGSVVGALGALIGGALGGIAGTLSSSSKGGVPRSAGKPADPGLIDRMPRGLGYWLSSSIDPSPAPALPFPEIPAPQPASPSPASPSPAPACPPAPSSPAPARPRGPSSPAPAPPQAIPWRGLPSGDERLSGEDWSAAESFQPFPAAEAAPVDSVGVTPEPIEVDAALRPGLERYPEIEYPAEVGLGVRTSLFVALLRRPSAPETMSVLRIADTGRADQLPQLEVVVRAHGFDIEPSNTQLLTVERDDDVDVRFVLIPRQPGPQTIRVDFYQDGRRIGTLRHATTVVERAPAAPPRPLAVVEEEPLQFAVGAAPPDLELCVEVDPDDSLQLYFSLHSTVEAIDYHHARMGSVRLNSAPLERMQAVYAELSTLAGSSPPTLDELDYQRRRLARIGNQLWEELFSPELKAAYWQFKDQVTTLLITSDEPWIPWEIVRPFRFDAANARIDEPHLCERFVIARWLSGNGPAERVTVRRVRPVAPGVVNLESVQAELSYLQRIDQLSAGLVPETPYTDRNRVIDLFESGDFSVLHFAAHGSFDATLPSNSSISLTGGPLRPSDLFARFGGPRARPLIFINACHGARAEFAFTGLGGWADRLVRQSRVAAFIGAAWEVNDRLALLFTETFYTALLRDRKTIGESFQIARLRVRDEEPTNSTWLAYVLYADPAASVTVISN